MTAKGAFAPDSELPPLPSGWRWSRLEDSVDQDRGICYGIVQPGTHDPDGIPMVNSQDILDGAVSSSVAFRVSPELHKRYRRSTIRGGEILLTLVGANFGRVAIAPPYFVGFNCSRAVGILPVVGCSKYIHFCLRSPIARHFMDNWANTTAQPTFNLKDVASLPIPLPPPQEQEAIAHILGTLDDKIELNRRMNETLESIARALFKSWFVDFEPVRAKAERRDTGLPREITDLFPDAFEESELGEIPRGWRCGSLAEYSLLNPESWSTETAPDEIEYVDLANTKWGKIDATKKYTWDAAPSRAQRVLRVGDTIIGTVRPGNGSYALVSDSGLTGSTAFAVLRPRKPQFSGFVYLASTDSENIQALAHLADGGAYPAVRPDVVMSKGIVLPPAVVMSQFFEVTTSLLSRMTANNRESHILAEARNSLLPKLISGEIRVM
jgi:type I restriction enzyme, S subunit